MTAGPSLIMMIRMEATSDIALCSAISG